MTCKECERKEGVIQKYKAGQLRRDDLVDMIENLIADRAHWRRMAQEGSKTANRTINDLKQKLARTDAELTMLKSESVNIINNGDGTFTWSPSAVYRK